MLFVNNNLDTVNYYYQFIVGTLLKSKFPYASQEPVFKWAFQRVKVEAC